MKVPGTEQQASLDKRYHQAPVTASPQPAELVCLRGTSSSGDWSTLPSGCGQLNGKKRTRFHGVQGYYHPFLRLVGWFGCAGSSQLCGLFSSCSERGLPFGAVCWLLIAVASLAADHVGLVGSAVMTQLLCGMWDLPRPGIESTSPVLAGGVFFFFFFFTTEPPGKP